MNNAQPWQQHVAMTDVDQYVGQTERKGLTCVAITTTQRWVGDQRLGQW